jgi:hypothetical protein
MTTPMPANSADDDDHLRLLTIFHYIVAGLTALFGCMPCIHLSFGIAFLAGAFHDDHGVPAPRFIGVILVVVASAMIIMFWTLALFIFFAGRNLARRRRHTFCFVMACIECVFMPFGTVLGVFSIIVLMRPSVKQLFGVAASGVPPIT